MGPITPCLWFDTEALEAAEYYVATFPGSRVTRVTNFSEAGPGEEGTALLVEFELDGRPFSALNGGPEFHFNEAISLQVSCRDQDESDDLWRRLSAEGEEGRCGWLKDRYGVSWQVVPEGLLELLNDPDPGRAARATRAMMGMGRIDLAAMLAAADERD